MKFDSGGPPFMSFASDMRKPLRVLGALSVILLFTSISSTEPNVQLLTQLSSRDFVGHRNLVTVSDCQSPEAKQVDTIQVEIDGGQFSVREIILHDGFNSSEHLFLDRIQSQKRDWISLKEATCIASLEIVGHEIASDGGKRPTIKIWGYQH